MSESNDARREQPRIPAAGTSRRDFLRQAASVGLSSTALGALWPAAAGAEAISGPTRGGHFRVANSGHATSDSLDPALLEDSGPALISEALRSHLVEIAPNLSARPELAASIEPNRVADRWVVKLRRGVEFHNGKTLDADDVVSSFARHMGEDTKSAGKSLLEPIVEIKKDGPDTVIFLLREGNADFPYLLADYHFPITPAGTSNFEKGVGTGGYVLEHYEPGVRADMKRFENYFREDSAYFDSATVFAVLDVNARTTGLMSGDFDAISQPDKRTLHLIEASDGVELLNVEGFTHMTMPMLMDQAPFDNYHVRKALKHAIDRPLIVKNALRGYGQVAKDHPIAPGMRYHAADVPGHSYDADKVRYHLGKANMSKLELELFCSQFVLGMGVDVATLYAQSAKEVGINIDINRAPSDGYWNDVWMKEPWCQSYYSGRPTEDWMFSLVYLSNASWNETRWSNEQFDKIILEARSELDEARRRELYREAQILCSDDCGTIIPFFVNTIDAISARVGHPKTVGANLALDGRRCIERWWFKDA